MREGLHSLWRIALMPLLSSPTINFNEYILIHGLLYFVYLEIYSNVLYSVVGFSYQVLRRQKRLSYCTLRLSVPELSAHERVESRHPSGFALPPP